MKCIEYEDSTKNKEYREMIDLLIQVFYVLLALAAISLFVCTIPIWLVVLLVVLVFR